MLDQYPVLKLRGRSGECELLDRLVADVREGRSRVWVLRGEAGIGRTALLDHLAAVASGCRVVRTAGVESEMELAYAGLHQFCSSMLGGVDHLSAPQRDALSVAFGLQAGPAPDQFMVGLAVLGLLTQAAEEQPQVRLIDDAQWLDQVSAQTLAFVARRLLAERVALIFTVRDDSDGRVLPGLPELTVRGLLDGDARSLLDTVTQGPLENAVAQTTNVVGLVYVAAFAPDEGETVAGIVGRSNDSILMTALVEYQYPTGRGQETGTELIIDPAKFRRVVAADLPERQSDVCGRSQRPMAAGALGEETSEVAWKNLPSWAAVGTVDLAAGSDIVRSMAQRADATVTEVQGSHLIMMSQPDAVADVILTAHSAVS